MTTRKELDLQTELAAARALTGHQLEKIQRQRATIAKLERKIAAYAELLKRAQNAHDSMV